MQYKRHEYFRYTFSEPCEATFRIIKDASATGPAEISKKGTCEIMDISPSGLKIFTKYTIAIDKLNHVEICFQLDETPITISGEFVWSRRKINGCEYGIKLLGDNNTEQLIISELKSRRRKETTNKK